MAANEQANIQAANERTANAQDRPTADMEALDDAVRGILGGNPVLRQMMAHRSIRSYTDEPVADDELKAIVEAIERGPNWCNFQHVSIVQVADGAKRQRMYELCGNQRQVLQAPVFLMFCADFHRTWMACGCSQQEFDRVTAVRDNLVVGACEVGIALGSATVAAESLGLGTCCIGAAREFGQEVVGLLGLPRYVFPVCGLCIGHGAERPDLKPRIPAPGVFFKDSYGTGLEPLLREYDRAYGEYLASRSSNPKEGTWSQEVAGYYTVPYERYQEIPAMLAEQGF